MADQLPPETPAGDGPGVLPDSSVEVSGRVDRTQSLWGLIGVGVVAVGLMLWLLSGRTPPDDQAVSVDEVPTSLSLDDGSVDAESSRDRPADTPQTTSATATTAPVASVSPVTSAASGADTSTTVGSDTWNLRLPGWRLAVGDGHNVSLIDLHIGDRRRHTAVGAPLAADGDRLLFYQNAELFWLLADHIDFDDETGSESLAGVPTLQVMFVRPRSTDQPVVVNHSSPTQRAIWWPNNNSDPQRWLKISLTDGSTLDELSLSNEVFGGPEVVATLGSGSFERVDGAWQPLGDFFALSVSDATVLGQHCESPDRCEQVALDRQTGTVRSVPTDLADLSEATLVAGTDRPMVIIRDGLLNLNSGVITPMPDLNVDSLVVGSGSIAAAAQGPVGEMEATILLADMDSGERALLAVDLVPRWMVLMPPT